MSIFASALGWPPGSSSVASCVCAVCQVWDGRADGGALQEPPPVSFYLLRRLSGSCSPTACVRLCCSYDGVDNILITPHVGSRTGESVQRQACRATTNIVQFLTGGKDYIQANKPRD